MHAQEGRKDGLGMPVDWKMECDTMTARAVRSHTGRG